VAINHYKESPKDKHTLGSHEEFRKDLRCLYFANRVLAGMSNGVSTSSGNSATENINQKGNYYID
jgi:hypothetical protein